MDLTAICPAVSPYFATERAAFAGTASGVHLAPKPVVSFDPLMAEPHGTYRRAARGRGCYKGFTDVREFTSQTRNHREFIDITDRVQAQVHATGVLEGICLVFSPHATARGDDQQEC